jgi:hypothetical protein
MTAPRGAARGRSGGRGSPRATPPDEEHDRHPERDHHPTPVRPGAPDWPSPAATRALAPAAAGSHSHHRARPTSSSRAAADAPTKIPPSFQGPPARRPGRRGSATGKAASQGRRAGAGSTSCRSSRDGRTLRMASSGQSAQKSAVRTPMLNARTRVQGSGAEDSAMGISPAMRPTMSGCAARPRAIPSALPLTATSCVWRR